MKTKLLLWLAVASISTAAWASEPEAVNVHQKSGTITSTMFEDFTNLELNGDVLIVHKRSGESITIAMDNVTNILWGDYVQSSNTGIENIISDGLHVYHIATEGVINSADAIKHYVVFDALGRFICGESLATDTHEVRFATDSWAHGIYLVCVETTLGKSTAKIIL